MHDGGVHLEIDVNAQASVYPSHSCINNRGDPTSNAAREFRPRRRGLGCRSPTLSSDLFSCDTTKEEDDGTAVSGDRYAECAICFEPLCHATVGAFWYNGQRACPHVFHLCCAEACPQNNGCPLCRSPYYEVNEVPPPSSPVEWFGAMDVDRNGRLSLSEVRFATLATLPVEVESLEEVLPVLWASRGATAEESLTFSQLFGPGGLMSQLQENLHLGNQPTENAASWKSPKACEVAPGAPDLHVDKQGWFKHWDTDGSGVLEREEVIRGLAKCFRSDVPSAVCKKRLRMRCAVEAMWPLVDDDGNDRIALNEFCRQGGLADMILQRFTAIADPVKPRRQPQPQPQPHQKLLSLPRQTRVAMLDARWGSADLSDDGRNDRPRLPERQALGFSTASTRLGRRKAQWASEDDRLGRLAKPASRLPRKYSQESDIVETVESVNEGVCPDGWRYATTTHPPTPNDRKIDRPGENATRGRRHHVNAADEGGASGAHNLRQPNVAVNVECDVKVGKFNTWPISKTSSNPLPSPALASPSSSVSPWLFLCPNPDFHGDEVVCVDVSPAGQDVTVTGGKSSPALRRRSLSLRSTPVSQQVSANIGLGAATAPTKPNAETDCACDTASIDNTGACGSERASPRRKDRGCGVSFPRRASASPRHGRFLVSPRCEGVNSEPLRRPRRSSGYVDKRQAHHGRVGGPESARRRRAGRSTVASTGSATEERRWITAAT
eukprot:TRINITY_DN56032_c0_g1_i1.p1 TRINITY_DN56032_c0_g1~~TRINITY_DN56032_c0_g1_i1.p1  ORF type:complete len:744 (+),score=83.31 TRINITY_DN56032_c0_g1_i1:64-2232(+)